MGSGQPPSVPAGSSPPGESAPAGRADLPGRGRPGAIRVLNAREHNLKGVDVSIPRDRFTVVTGVSGSGKSTLAFDILFAEGQRRYLESLNAYARQFVQPARRAEVDAVLGIPPTVAIEQRTGRGGRKSTVATLTEAYHFLRLLFVRLGVQHCPDCGGPIEPRTPDSIVAQLLRERRGQRAQVLAPLVVARKGYYTDLARWAAGKGYRELRVDGVMTPTGRWPRIDRFREHDIDLPVGEVVLEPRREGDLRGLLGTAFEHGKGLARVGESLFSTRRACPSCGRSFPEPDPRLFSFNSKHGWCERCYGTGALLPGFDAEQSGEEVWWNDWFEGEEKTCPACAGEGMFFSQTAFTATAIYWPPPWPPWHRERPPAAVPRTAPEPVPSPRPAGPDTRPRRRLPPAGPAAAGPRSRRHVSSAPPSRAGSACGSAGASAR